MSFSEVGSAERASHPECWGLRPLHCSDWHVPLLLAQDGCCCSHMVSWQMAERRAKMDGVPPYEFSRLILIHLLTFQWSELSLISSCKEMGIWKSNLHFAWPHVQLNLEVDYKRKKINGYCLCYSHLWTSLGEKSSCQLKEKKLLSCVWLFVYGISSQNTGEGSLPFPRGIFPTQEMNTSVSCITDRSLTNWS